MSAETFLSCLDGVKRTGNERWQAKCPSHEDRTASLSIRELDDGRVLVHCFAGCSVHEVLGSVGLGFDALYPEKPVQYGKPERRPFPAADVLRAIYFESLVIAAASSQMQNGNALSETDRERIILASERIMAGITAAGLNHG